MYVLYYLCICTYLYEKINIYKPCFTTIHHYFHLSRIRRGARVQFFPVFHPILFCFICVQMTDADMDESESFNQWKIAAICAAVYFLVAVILFVVVGYLKSEQDKRRAKQLTKKTLESMEAGRIRPASSSSNINSKSTAGKGSHESENHCCLIGNAKGSQKEPTTSEKPVPIPSALLSADGAYRIKRGKYFLNEDITQEITQSLKGKSEPQVITAQGSSSTSIAWNGPINQIEILTPPSTYSGTETVPQTELPSATQRDTNKTSRTSTSFSSSTSSSSTTSTLTESLTSSTDENSSGSDSSSTTSSSSTESSSSIR